MNTFKELTSLEDIENLISNNQLAFLYITMPNCSVCHGLQPQIERILASFPKIAAYKVDASKITEIAGRFTVFTAPVLLLFVNGKEYIREARFVQTELLQNKITRIYNNLAN
ncbi:thioredoxin family protein [Pseudogracilibacillus sp. SO30301A]|uniref:thioredoxin family protein n=1 Tax=Pseudogracilibacillus sp. SO30301A TaxID=3098291 RepID=UPI00300E482A